MSGTVYPRQLIVLYHAVAPPNTHPILDGAAHNVRPDTFERQLNWLGRFYDFAPLSDVVGAMKNGSRERLVALTFDDGYRCVEEFAAPVLAARQIPFTVFLISSVLNGKVFWRDGLRAILLAGHEAKFLDHLRDEGHDAPRDAGSLYRWSKSIAAGDSRLIASFILNYAGEHGIFDSLDSLYLDESTVARMPDAGISFGNHTQSHLKMATLDKDAQRDEISAGLLGLEGVSNIDSDVLSLPFGGADDWNSDTLEIAAEAGYSTVLSTTTGKPGSTWHTTAQGRILEVQRSIASQNVRGIMRSISGF